jgi:hypothetical protein
VPTITATSSSCVGNVNSYFDLKGMSCQEAKTTYDLIKAGQYQAVPSEPGKVYVNNYYLCWMNPKDLSTANPAGSLCLKYSPELKNTDTFTGSFVMKPR